MCLDVVTEHRATGSVRSERQSVMRLVSRAKSEEDRMANSLKIKVNGLTHGVSASLDTPLLYVLHNELHLHGPRFGCGLAQCGACSVLLDGKEIRSCVTPVAAVSGKAITTLEGL